MLATATECYVCVTADHAWGKGETADAAKRNARKQGSAMKRYVVVVVRGEGAGDATVDSMDGTIMAPRGCESEVVERKGQR